MNRFMVMSAPNCSGFISVVPTGTNRSHRRHEIIMMIAEPLVNPAPHSSVFRVRTRYLMNEDYEIDQFGRPSGL